jgi:cell division protein FtsL
MTKQNFKNLFAIVLAAMLVIAMQLIQSGNEIPSFKFWICFWVIVAALLYIVYVAFTLAKSLRQARKQIVNLSQQISEVSKEDLQSTNIEQ